MSFFVKMLIQFPRVQSVRLGRHHYLGSLLHGQLYEFICIVRLIRNGLFCMQSLNQIASWGNIRHISTGQMNPDRVTQAINDGVDFSGQTAFTASYFLFGKTSAI